MHRLSGISLLALASLPFLVTVHTVPLVSFYSEWVAAALGLLFVAGAVFSRSAGHRALALPASALPLAALAFVLLLQGWLGRVAYGEANQLALLVAIWAGLLMVAAGTLRQAAGLDAICSWFAGGLLAAALASVLVTVAGHAGYRGIFAANFVAGPIYGNLGQPNHFAHLLWLGVAGIAYLWSSGRVRAPAAVLALLPLLLMSANTGSRATLVYAAWMTTLLWYLLPNGRRHIAPGLMGAYVLAAWQLPRMLGALGVSGGASPVLNAVTLATSQKSDRLGLLSEAWNMFAASPWLGGGWGGFRHWSFETGDRPGIWKGGAEHSHNLFSSLLAETGILPAAVTALVLLLWFASAWRRRRDPAASFLLMVAGIGLLHAQVEYPFWYMFFLAVFVIALALGETRLWQIPFRNSLAALLLASSAGVLFVIGKDYVMLERLVRPAAPIVGEEAISRQIEAVLAFRRHSLLAPQADMALLGVIGATRDNLDAKQAFCRQSLAYNPARPGVFNCALVAELAGDRERASRLWLLAAESAGPQEVRNYVSGQIGILTPAEQAPLSRFLHPRQ